MNYKGIAFVLLFWLCTELCPVVRALDTLVLTDLLMNAVSQRAEKLMTRSRKTIE